MHPGISSPGTMGKQALAGHALQRGAEQALHSDQAGLHLPAVEVEPVVRQRDFQIARHRDPISTESASAACGLRQQERSGLTKLYKALQQMTGSADAFAILWGFRNMGSRLPSAPIPRTVSCREELPGGNLRTTVVTFAIFPSPLGHLAIVMENKHALSTFTDS
jgi:hypothetical protein